MKHEALSESKREKIRDRKGGLLKGRPPELGYLSRISEGRQQGYRIPHRSKIYKQPNSGGREESSIPVVLLFCHLHQLPV